MRLRFFTVPVFNSKEAQDELNIFLASHVVVQIDRQFVQDAKMGSMWSVCVSYHVSEEAGKTETSIKKGRIDYRELLSESDFAVYVELRDLRKKIAEKEGIPTYDKYLAPVPS